MTGFHKFERNARSVFASEMQGVTEFSEGDHYAYRVIWSAEDGEYVGLCAEFPSLSWLAQTQIEALSGILELVQDTVNEMQLSKEPVPQAIVDRLYSGKFTVRIPQETHRALSVRAAEEGVSLNALVSTRLSRDVA